MIAPVDCLMSDLHYVGHMWPNIVSIARLASANSVKVRASSTRRVVVWIAEQQTHITTEIN
jgi:predicted glycoside hydrolase/deacetylase ChbG (UPF0249 family)